MKSFLILVIVLVCFSCKKESFITSPDAGLYTDADTLSFDTVFTTAGSITRSFKIFNPNSQKINLSDIRMSGGITSPFKMNVDGTSAAEVHDVQINANDSIYVFVQADVDPSSATLPYLLSDSLEIDYNGNKKYVQLQAYGQNAVFLKMQQLTGNITWNKNLPYVIIGGIRLDTNATLTIEAGTRIFLHADAPFLVDGTLKINGTREEPVIFTGDRLDEEYKDLPAGWPGIYFRTPSENNSLRHVIIKNGYQGIIAQDLPSTTAPKVVLSHCIIEGIYDAGILGIHSSIDADNCLITNCGSNLELELGGNYHITGCTVASYGTIYLPHKSAVLQLSDFMEGTGAGYTASMNALFKNCIFWGDGTAVDNEIEVNQKGTGNFTVSFDHVLYKAKNEIANATFISSVKNADPLFDSIDVPGNIFDFHLNTGSPAINAGTLTPFPDDLDNKPRDATPDLGCYER